MKSVGPVKTAKAGYIVLSVSLALLGILLICDPGLSVGIIGTAVGILMIVFGTVKLVGYFSRDLFRLAFQYDLAFGILLITLGIIVLLRPESVMTFICIAIGISTLADALFKIQIAADSKQFGIRRWWLILVFAAISAAVGLVLVCRPGQSSELLVVLLGITLLSEGILNLITVLTAVKILKASKPDEIVIDYRGERKD